MEVAIEVVARLLSSSSGRRDPLTRRALAYVIQACCIGPLRQPAVVLHILDKNLSAFSEDLTTARCAHVVLKQARQAREAEEGVEQGGR